MLIKTSFYFILTFCLLFSNVILESGIYNLNTIDNNKRKIGILSLSATKILPFVESSYTLKNLSAEEFKSMHDFLHDAGYVADNYREWLESADIQVIPVLFFGSLTEISDLMEKVDGFVLTGGSESFYNYEGFPSLYIQTVTHILKKAKEINDSGRVFPLWGTCLGFEAIIVAESGETLRRREVMNHVKLREKIEIVDDSLRSIKFFSEEELNMMEDIPLLYFNHMWGVSRWDIMHLPEIENKIKIGAKINTDVKRNVAVWMEFVNYPFFGTQFHPEKEPMSGANPFDQKREEQIGIEEQEDQDQVNTEEVQAQFLGDYVQEINKQNTFFNNTSEDTSDTTKTFNSFKNENSFKNQNDNKNKKNFLEESKDKDEDKENKRNILNSKKMKNVHVASENEYLKSLNNDSLESKNGVDSIAPPIVSDPSLISEQYLKNVKTINEKFAKFFSTYIPNNKFKLSEEFLKKQMYWLKNIGSYYQVNIIRNDN